MDISRESGRLCEDIIETIWSSVQEKWDDDPDYRKNKWKFWVPLSLPFAEVVRDPPPLTPQHASKPLAELKLLAAVLADCVGVTLSKKFENYFQIATAILGNQIKVSTRFALVFLGLDWCLQISRNQIREGVCKLIFAIGLTNPSAIIGISGVTHGYVDYATTKIKMVNFNHTVRVSVQEMADEGLAVQFLHLHYLDSNYNSVQPIYM